MNLNNPIPTEWTNYVTQSTVGLEVIPSLIYDTKTYTSATTTLLTYFQQAEATADLGNLNTNGMFPNPQSYLIQAIRVFYKYAGVAGTTVASQPWNDVVLLANTGIMRIVIGEKRYGPFPLWALPSGSGVLPSVAGSGSTNYIGYGQVVGNMYALYPNLMIAPLQNFVVTLEWPAGAVTLAAANNITVAFDGQLARAIQ